MEREFRLTRTGAAEIFNTGQGRPFMCEAFTKMPRSREVRVCEDVKGLDDLTPDEVYFAKIEMRQAA
jgi:hypothetical protein